MAILKVATWDGKMALSSAAQKDGLMAARMVCWSADLTSELLVDSTAGMMAVTRENGLAEKLVFLLVWQGVANLALPMVAYLVGQ